jgi:CheY-like chemotaxis protein
MKILVIEDKKENIEAAKKQLSEHQLQVISGYDEVHEYLREEIDKEKLEDYLKKNLPKGWSSCFEKNNYTYMSPDGNEVKQWNLPNDIKKIIIEAEKASPHIPFDVVLTDVMIPKGGNNCCRDDGKIRPYGPIIALRAISLGIKKVGVITSGNHHEDPIVYAFDHLPGFTSGDLKVVCTNQMDTYVKAETYEKAGEDYWERYKAGEVIRVKDWKKLLEKIVQ